MPFPSNFQNFFRSPTSVYAPLKHEAKAAATAKPGSMKSRTGSNPRSCFGAVKGWSFFLLLCIAYFFFVFWWAMSQAFDDDGAESPGYSFGWKSQPVGEEEDPRKLRIVVCAKITSEIPYLLEWIEFHRIQGVDKFVLYHDAIPAEPKTVKSALELEWLPPLYRDAARRFWAAQHGWKKGKNKSKHPSEWDNSDAFRDGENIVEVQSGSLLIPDMWPSMYDLHHNTMVSHRLLQPVIVTDCLDRYKDRAEYIMHIDVDEFAYSPTSPTLWHWLEELRAGQKWARFINGRYVGVHLPSINFGSSGQFWNFHNGWSAGMSPGAVIPHFDPRDSSLFRFLTELKTFDDSESIGMLLDRFRMRRDISMSELPATVPEFVKTVKTKLEKDYPNNTRHGLVHEDLILPKISDEGLEPDIFQNLTKLVQEAIEMLGSSRVDAEDNNNHLSDSPSAISMAGILEKVKIYNKELDKARLFYPLIIEEQIRRGPSQKLEESGKRVAAELFPACQQDPKTRRKYLIEQESFSTNSDSLNKTLSLLHPICRGTLPGTVTMAGKTIYFTSALRRSPRSRRNGKLRGCFKPGVHACSHYVYGGLLYYPNAKNEARVDHHQFRSYEHRSFALPKWRGGPLGYPEKFNYTILQGFLTAVVDTSKLRFIPQLRTRLAAFHVMPKLPDYSVLHSKDDFQIAAMNLSRHCSALQLLGEHQVMCPPDFPYVGFRMSDIVPPHPYVPYGWCTKVKIPSSEALLAWQAPFHLGQFVAETNKSADPWKKYATLCPGYGEANCCDYDASLASWSSKGFEKPRVWKDRVHGWSALLYS